MTLTITSEVADNIGLDYDTVKAVIAEFALQLHRYALEYRSGNGDFIGENLWCQVEKKAFYHLLGFLDYFAYRYDWERGDASEYLMRLGSDADWMPFDRQMEDWQLADSNIKASCAHPRLRGTSGQEEFKYRDKIIKEIAQDHCRKISGKVIRKFKKMKEGMQSGDDTPLKNIWDEICVQVQGEESVFYDIYQYMIRSSIQYEVENLKDEIKQAIWLQTDRGFEWEYGDESHAEATCCEEDITDHIFYKFVLSAAGDWTNKRIEKFLEREFD